MTDYTTGDKNLKINITNEKNVTINDVVNEASALWRITRSRKLKLGDLEAADALMNELRKTNPQLCKSYPIVLRYMVQMQEFEPKALHRYLRKIQAKPWKTESEYLDSQADYVVILYQTTHPRWNKTQCSKLWQGVRNMLQHETDLFKQYVDEFDREVSAQEEMFKKASMDDLREFVQNSGDTIETHGGTVRVETELNGGDDVDMITLTSGMTSVELMSADDLLG